MKLTRLFSNHENLRTGEVIGTTIALPLIEERFVLFAEPHESGIIRVVETSPVKMVHQEIDGNLEFITDNSWYKLELLGEEE